MYKLPIIVIERTGITKNDDRLANLHNEIKYRIHSKILNYDILTPVPIDIQYKVTIASKYQDHVDRCVGNFIPFFNKDLYVRSIHPKFEDVEYTNQVIMDNNIEFERPDEIEPNQDDIAIATVNFTFKTYMFCGVEKGRLGSVQHIIKTFISCNEETDESCLVSAITDTIYDGFIPRIDSIGIGFYPIPLLSTYQGQFDFVDSLVCTELSDCATLQDPYVDCFKWVINEQRDDVEQLSGRYYHIGD